MQRIQSVSTISSACSYRVGNIWGQTSSCQSLAGTCLKTCSSNPQLLAVSNCLQNVSVREGKYRPPCSCVACNSQMNARRRNVPCSLDKSQSVIQSTTTVSRSACVSTINFVEVPFRQIKSYRATFTSTFCLGIVTENRTHIHQANFSVGELSLLLLQYCCQRLEVLLHAPCASSILPAVRRLHQSFRSLVPKPVLQVAVVQVAVALAEAVTPSHCCCYCYHLPGAAQEPASPSPSGRCLLR